MITSSFHLISSAADLARALPALEAAPVLGLDLETTGLDPYTSRPRLLQLATTDTAFIIDLFAVPREALGPVLDLISDDRILKVSHNAKFDAKFLLAHYDTRMSGIFDTYLASQMISAGSEVDRHSLEAVAQRNLGVQMDKTAQTSDWSGELHTYQLEYAARDASTLVPLQEALEARLDEMDLKMTSRLEFDCILPIAVMELAGVFLDSALWRTQVARIRAEHHKCAEALQAELSRGASQLTLFEEAVQINLDSPQQVRDALAGIGIEVEGTSEWRLHRLAEEYPVIKLLLEYRGLSKSLSSYGETMLEFINPGNRTNSRRLPPDRNPVGPHHVLFTEPAAGASRAGVSLMFPVTAGEAPHSRGFLSDRDADPCRFLQG